MRNVVTWSLKCSVLALLIYGWPSSVFKSQAQYASTRPVRFGAALPVPNDASGGVPTRGPVSGTKGPGGTKTTVTTSWEGMSSDFFEEPPDPHGAAGPNGIIQIINTHIAY